MAIFNPAVQPGQVDDPNYFKYSEPIKNIQADTSSGETLSALGKGFDQAVDLADTTVKDVIKKDVHDRVDPDIQGYTQALVQLKVDPTGTKSLQDDPTGDNTNVPPQLANGINTIQRIGAAAQAGGKPSETLLNQRLDSTLKDLRSTYPGYRDYIDSEMQKATGRDVANSYINSLREDISKQSENANKEQTFWRGKIVDNAGFKGSEEMLSGYTNGTKTSNDIMKWLSANQSQLDNLKLLKAQADAANQDKATELDNNTKFVQATANHAVVDFFMNGRLAGQNGGMSPSQIADAATDLSLHPEKANDNAVQQLTTQYQAAKSQAYNETWLMLNKREKQSDGSMKSYADKVGPDVAKGILDKTISATFDATGTLLGDKDFGLAHTVQRAVENTVTKASWNVLSNNKIGDRIATAGAFNKIAGPQIGSALVGSAFKKGLDSDTSTFLDVQKQQALTQTGGQYYQGSDGKPYTFNQSIDELKKKGAIDSASGGAPPSGAAYNDLIGVRSALVNWKNAKDPETTMGNAITYFYDPANKGSMSKFMDDYYDPASSRVVQGRDAAFASLTGNDVTKNIWDYAQGHPGAWMNYSNWAKGEFSTQLRNQIGNLDTINKQGDDFRGGLPASQFKVSWDADNHQFILKNHDGTSLEGIQSTPLNQAYRTVTTLNQGLKNLSTIAKTEGSNVDAYVFKVLKDGGFNPNKDIDGVPAQVMRAMITANGHTPSSSIGGPKVPVSQ